MDKNVVFKEFLDKYEILIVDKNPGSRNRLLKTMYDMGAKRHMIHTSGSLFEAQKIIEKKKIGVVLSDYLIGGGSGFDLFKLVRAQFPDNKELCLVLVTSNISQSAVAKAAEEDVDSFIIKPYTIQSIQENLISTIVQKFKPSPYIVKVEEGKQLIAEKKYTEAISTLQAAMELHSKPALALFYIGQAEYLQLNVERASDSYSEGLVLNNIHYKCLVGLYELFMRDQKFGEAYQVVKKIAKFFPANPDRLTEIIHLAVRTGNINDMQMYYEIFMSLDERVQKVINYIGAGMYIAGKTNLSVSPEVALKYFENVIVSCGEYTKFTRAIISLLVENDMAKHAEKYLNRFSNRTQEDYLVSNYLITSQLQKEEHGLIVFMGLELYNKKIRNFACLNIMLEAMAKAGYKKEKIEPFQKELESYAQ
jgi:CheY-like chemotaxis protein